MTTTTPTTERRAFCRGELRVKRSDNKMTLSGYAAKFGVVSVDLGGFREQIAPGTFGKAVGSDADVFLLRSHDSDAVLARTKSGTLRLEQDGVGLKFEADLADTAQARDLFTLVERGDLDAMSFGFSTVRDAWAWDGPVAMRTLQDVELFEISVVAWPAYPQTDVGVRCRQAYEAFRGLRGMSPEEARLKIAEAELAATTSRDA